MSWMYYLEFETLKQILSLNDQVLQSALKKVYSIEAGPYDLVESAIEINNLLGKDVLGFYSLHLIANFTIIKNVIAKLGVNPTYLEELEEMDRETFKNMQIESSRSDDLDGFNVTAFNAVIDALSKEEEEVIVDFQAQFDYLPKYLIEKYRLEQLRQTISKKEVPKKELDEKIKNLKKHTEASLRKIIELFNNLNSYALRNRISIPYPFKYNKILVDDKTHRKDVQKVLIKHTPIKTIANIHS